jgi:hypothetical protein
MFRKDGEIVAGDEHTTNEVIGHVVDSFDGVLEKADAIGGIGSITIEGSEGRVDISCFNDFYMVTVTSKGANVNYVGTLTRVLVPTVLKIVEKISTAPLKNGQPPQEIESEIPMVRGTKQKKAENAGEMEKEEPKEPDQTELDSEPLVHQPTANQFMVENLGGLLVPSDTVRIDGQTLQQWEELYENKKIEQVQIETFDGKLTQCKVRPMNDPKYEGKGIVRMPEKIQGFLEIKKGELVRVKPVVD